MGTDRVFVVATYHPDSQRPKCEGVYQDEEDAMKGEREAIRHLGAGTAEVYEMEVR